MRSEDEIFVNRCLAGDQPAFAFLVDKYKEVVHAYAYRKVGDYQEAEDITQEVFIKAYRKLAQLKWPHRFRSWLYTIVSNECKMWLRKQPNGGEQEVSWEDVPAIELRELAMRSHGDEDIKLTVKSAIETLPDDRQLAVSLYYMSSLPVKEIAEFMGVSPNSVRIKLHRARKQLGERLEKMIGKHLSKEKLRSGFVFKVVDAIRDMPIPSLPSPRSTRWGPIPISIGLALLIGVIGYGMSSGKDVSQNMPVLKYADTPVEVSLLPDVDEQLTLDIKAVGDELVALNSGDDTTPKAGGSSNTDIAIRKAWDSMRDAIIDMAISPDGRYLSFCNNGNGNLAVRDLTTGQNRDITDEGTWYGAQSHAETSAWSPDGKQIACAWTGGGHQGLRIFGLDGSQPRDLYTSARSPELWINECHDWSKDGKYILASYRRKTDRVWKIGLFSVADGSVRILKSSATGLNKGSDMSLSPDGRYVAYDHQVKEHERLRDIFLLATDGSGEEVRLTEHPADDYNPVWAPDGKTIVFVSNRDPGGGMGLWLMQVVDGKPVGEPQLVKREVGNIALRGFTRKGSLFYTTETSWSHIYVASLDMETGEVLEPPTPLLRSQDFNLMPAWSPDGKSLAYVSKRASPGGFGRRMALVIRSMETREERELFSSRDYPGQLCWAPDGRSILYCRLRWGPLRLIDVQTGHITEIAKTDNNIYGPAWSPDGKTIYYTGQDVSNEVGDWPSRIVALDLETRQARELYSRGTGGFMAVSPDGRQLAFLDDVNFGGTSWKETLAVLPTSGGKPRTLLDRKDLNMPDTYRFEGPFSWTSDGRYVLFTVEDSTDVVVQEGPTELWQVPAEGGKPKKLLEIESPYRPSGAKRCRLSLHPDGRRIAFQKGEDRQMDLWVMEDLLPTSTASR